MTGEASLKKSETFSVTAIYAKMLEMAHELIVHTVFSYFILATVLYLQTQLATKVFSLSVNDYQVPRQAADCPAV